jgi:hypothetical protein
MLVVRSMNTIPGYDGLRARMREISLRTMLTGIGVLAGAWLLTPTDDGLRTPVPVAEVLQTGAARWSIVTAARPRRPAAAVAL